MVNRFGTVSVLKVRLAGIVRVVSTMPGRIDPTTDPMPGKLAAPLKLPCSPPDGVPRREVKGGAMRLPVSPKLGPGPPTNGNCTNGWLPAGRKSGLKPVNCVEPETRSGDRMMAGPLLNGKMPTKGVVFGR